MNAKVGSLNVDLTIETARFEQGIRGAQSSMRAAQGEIQRLADKFSISTAEMGRAAQKLNASNGAMRAGMSQLSYQVSDVATQFASGQRPMLIFAQQSGQVVQALGLMTGGAGRLGAFLTGPWGLALTAATVAIAPFIPKLLEAGNAAAKAADQVSGLTDALERLRKEQGGVGDEGAALAKIGRLQGELLKVDQMQARGVARAGLASQKAKRRAEIEAEIAGLQQLVKWNETVRASRGASASSGGGSRSSGGTRGRDSLPSLTVDKSALDAVAQAALAAKDYASALELEASRLGLTTIELKHMEAASAAVKAPTAELALAITKAGDAWETAFRVQADADFQASIIRPLENELALLGLVGPAREKAALALEEQAFKAQMAAKGLSDVNAAWGEYAARQLELIDRKAGADQPMEKYLDSIMLTRDKIDEAFQNIGVNGLTMLNDGLTDAIMGAQTFGEVFSNVAKQIVADLIRIAIQQIIVNALMKLLGGNSLVGDAASTIAANPAIFATGGLVTGPGSGTSDSIHALLSNGEFVMTAEAVKKIGVGPLAAMNKFADGGLVGNLATVGERGTDIIALPKPAAMRSNAMPGGSTRVEIVPSPWFEALVVNRAASVAAPMAVRSGMASSQMTEQRMQRRARNRLPG